MNAWRAAAAISVALAALVISPVFGQRLPAMVVPEHYDLHFTPAFNSNTFGGNEIIRVRLTEPSDRITLHAADIEFHDVTIMADGRTFAATVTLDPRTETATLRVRYPLKAGM
jgi:aminopeptidase N